MPDYHPLDLARSANVGETFLTGDGLPAAIGRQVYRGIPFRIGGARPNRRRCLVGFHGSGGVRRPLTIPVRRRATYLVFAHVMVRSEILAGGPVGLLVAQYVFRLADGTEAPVPVRERFEINAPHIFGQLPFRAVTDRQDFLQPRYRGDWGASGWRQCEAMQGNPQPYYLWAWENPRPDVTVESVTIEPAGSAFAVAGITASRLREYPFGNTARREVKITLPRKTDADKPFRLEVEVDRGVATYPYPLPRLTLRQYLQGQFPGWGDETQGLSSPAYVQIAATPSATVTVRHDGRPIGKTRWGELERKRRVRRPRVQFEIVDRGRNWVHTTVVDDQTGRPLPCRIHFRSRDGIPFQPHGHHDHLLSGLGTWHVDVGGDLRLGQATYAYIDGACQGWLPRGPVVVDVGRGFEYEPLRTVVEIKPGQRDLVLRLKRWTDMNAQRWYSGDTHVHFLGERGAHREAGGEDLNVVNLLASQWGHLFTNTEDFIGRPTASPDGRTIVYCSQENRQHLLGHLSLLGLKQPVMPWCSDGPGEAEMGGNLETTLCHWADACHAQDGTVVIPHLPIPNAEPAALIATGRADAVEFLGQMNRWPYHHLEYYRYLNCGYRLPLVGGTDKMSSDVPVGLCRTYVQLAADEEFTYDAWCRGLRQGHTFVTSGPIIRLSVNGVGVGDDLRLSGNGGTVEIVAKAQSIFPIHVLQIIGAGQVVAETAAKKGARSLTVRTKLAVDKPTWFAARCAGPKYQPQIHHDGWRRGLFAHTSPVYVGVGEPWRMFDADTARYMLTLIDGSLSHVRRHARRFANEQQVTHHHRHRDHQAFLEQPFHEAAAAVHRRLHAAGLPH